MKKKDNFFIGWKGNMSKAHKRSLKRVLWPVFIAIPILILLIVFFTSPFGKGTFQLGNVQEYTGTFYDAPFPILIVDQGQLLDDINPAALLVGYGKNGANTYIDSTKGEWGDFLGKKVKIAGTLIYGKEKTLIELSKKENSFIEILDSDRSEFEKTEELPLSVSGEIIDPKCYFGVMKPGEGKVHKSCAIRCISGGIPPVLKTEHNGRVDYYILKGTQEEDINAEILEYVGEPVSMSGYSYETNSWKVLKINPKDIVYQ